MFASNGSWLGVRDDKRITPGSILFNNEQYVSVEVTAPDSSAFTYEWWLYLTVFPQLLTTMLDTTQVGGDGLKVCVDSSGNLIVNDGSLDLFSGSKLIANKWTHIALTRPDQSNVI
jgi:hypothetical protein